MHKYKYIINVPVKKDVDYYKLFLALQDLVVRLDDTNYVLVSYNAAELLITITCSDVHSFGLCVLELGRSNVYEFSLNDEVEW